jgi:hypothetical protein
MIVYTSKRALAPSDPDIMMRIETVAIRIKTIAMATRGANRALFASESSVDRPIILFNYPFHFCL